jgi:hypothetical protein
MGHKTAKLAAHNTMPIRAKFGVKMLENWEGVNFSSSRIKAALLLI